MAKVSDKQLEVLRLLADGGELEIATQTSVIHRKGAAPLTIPRFGARSVAALMNQGLLGYGVFRDRRIVHDITPTGRRVAGTMGGKNGGNVPAMNRR